METQYKEAKRTKESEGFVIELVVSGKSVRVPSRCYNQESASHTALAMLALNYPNVSGYNLLTQDGETLLEEVHPTPLMIHASPIIQQITGQQPLRMAVPIVASKNSEGEFKKMLDGVKAAGKLIDGTMPEQAPPSGNPAT